MLFASKRTQNINRLQEVFFITLTAALELSAVRIDDLFFVFRDEQCDNGKQNNIRKAHETLVVDINTHGRPGVVDINTHGRPGVV